jgi:hypothetical protein
LELVAQLLQGVEICALCVGLDGWKQPNERGGRNCSV